MPPLYKKLTPAQEIHQQSIIGEMNETKGRETPLERYHRHYNEYVVDLNKVVAGRYRNGQSNYGKVGVLLLIWEDDDMQVWTAEVQRLEQVFRETYHYDVYHYQIPTDRAITGLNHAVAEFAHRYDGPNNLGIVYYGGHGAKEDNRLKMYARSKPNAEGNPTAFFDEVIYHLERCDTDIFVITDCCYAAHAFSRVEVGKRKFELLTATGPEQVSYAPQNPRSFTRLLCNTLEELSREKHGFTTSKLYRKLYFQTGPEHKPFLFDQSVHDWGRISLQPLRAPGDGESQPSLSDAYLKASVNGDACLHMILRLRSKPKPHNMSELARAMHYLPHVKEIKFERMHAPKMEIEGFMIGVTQAMRIRPFVTRLRKRLEAKRQLTAAAQNIGTSSELEGTEDRPPSPRDPAHVANWNESKLSESYQSKTSHDLDSSEDSSENETFKVNGSHAP